MDFQNNSEGQLVLKQENEDIEIRHLNTEHCDNVESFSLDHLFNLLTGDKMLDMNMDTSKITILELSQCNLTDLPESCKKLNLKHLDLSRNNLTNVPTCLYSGLKELESLDLSYNKIQQFDMEPDCLPVIKVILLNNNKFQNVPKWFLTFRSTNLEEFNYSDNKAKHYSYLKNSFNVNFVKLKKLELRNSCLIDIDYSLLRSFKSLTYLDISNAGQCPSFVNKFKDLDDLFVKPKWQDLHVLKLQSLLLSLFPAGIAWIETLRELHLVNNFLSWLPDDIQYLVNLEVLDISNNNIIAIPSSILSLQKLAVIHASDNSIECVPDFSLMPNLKTLDLYNNMLDDFSCNLVSIDFVDVEYNYYDTKYIEDCSLYEEKRNGLRNKYSYVRYDGPKELSNSSCSSSSKSTDSDGYFDNSQTVCLNQISIDESENWDLPVKVEPKNPEIDSVDENWQGEDKTFCPKVYSKKNKIYVNDEDWMFVDFEES